MDELELLPLSPALAHEIAAYRATFPADRMRVTLNPDRIPGLDHLEEYENIPSWLRFCETMRGKITWFATVRKTDGKMVGALCFRHRLEYDDDDPEFASHIGYSIRPDERWKGYAKEQLRLALQVAKTQGLEKVRVICLDSNIGSVKTILANGGVYVDTLHGEESGLNVNRYDIFISNDKEIITMEQFKLSPLFRDGAVLCRNKEIRVWGTAEEGKHLTLILKNEWNQELGRDEVTAKEGKFLFRLPPQKAQVKCTLTLSDGQDCLSYSDIAIGDVYLAGGQSNMELELQYADEGKELIPVHSNPLVRYFNVPKFARFCPEAEEANENARWLPVAPGTARDMSAAAYYFAMKLQPEIQVPIGIIDCYWGGTSVTCWMDEETLNRTAEGQRYIREYKALWAGKSMEQYLAEEKAFFDGLHQWSDQADALKAVHPEYTNQQLCDEIGPCPPWNPPAGPGSPFRPDGLAHTMLERVIPATLTGVLFYQGEEDTWRTKCYDILLTSFILRLREQFQDNELPFLNVQLPMWIDRAATEDSKLWPALRLAQWKVYRNLRNTGLAIMLDQGEFDNIHPTNKRVVGDRLYEAALDVIYQRKARLSPFALGKYAKDGKLFISLSAPVFDRCEGEFLMEIAGEDGQFVPAETVLHSDEIILSSPAVPHPVMARYAWTDYAIVRLFGMNGLPLAPFWLE